VLIYGLRIDTDIMLVPTGCLLFLTNLIHGKTNTSSDPGLKIFRNLALGLGAKTDGDKIVHEAGAMFPILKKKIACWCQEFASLKKAAM
jgi:hypothetical protein